MDPLTMSDEQFSSLSLTEFHQAWDFAVRSLRNEPVLRPRSLFKDRLFRFANVAIEFYNSNHQSNQFELVDPLHYKSAGTEHYHLSFIARSKDDSSFLKLFFAEVSFSDDTVMARKCIIVEPCNPLFVIGCDSCEPEGVIYHPLHYRDPFDYRRPPLPFRSREYCAKRLLRKATRKKIRGGRKSLQASNSRSSLPPPAHPPAPPTTANTSSEAYIITSYEQNLNAEEVDELRMTTYGYANEALRVYNDEHGASFKTLGIVASVRFGFTDPYIGKTLWVHFIFKAMNVDSNIMDASPTYFFAEHGLLMEDTTTCVMIGDTYPSSAYPGTETSCAVCRVHCRSMIFHPEDFTAGRNGGNFADALVKDNSRTVKAKLVQKDDDSSRVARSEYLKALER